MHAVSVAFRSCVIGFALLVCVPAGAQEWDRPWADPYDRPARADISASTGFLIPSEWSDLVLLGTISSSFGILEQVLVREVRVDPNNEFSAAVTYWRGRYGFRTEVGFSRSSITVGGASLDAPTNGALESVDVNTWLYGVRGAIGFIEYTPQRWVWPYGFIGFGGVTYDLERRVSPPLLTFIERGRTDEPGEATLILRERGREFVLVVDELGLETVFAFSVGVGADFRIPLGAAGVGLRLEVSDHIATSPIRLQIRELGTFGVSDTHVRFGRVHHMRASAGLVVRIGR